jgi:sugar fermentation stimulation protein A
MDFTTPLVPGTLVKRYKRFLADVILEDGEMVTAHVVNPGAMTGLALPLSTVWLSKSDNPMRKLAYTWELVEADLGAGMELVGINTQVPNMLVADALAEHRLNEFEGYASVRREVKYSTNSRIDFLLEDPSRPPCYLEVKNVHLMRRAGRAEFPDSVTERGAKHLEDLVGVMADGARAVLLFLVQVGSANSFSVARDIDPVYGQAFDKARRAGLEVIVRRCQVTGDKIEIDGPVPVLD